MEFFMIAPHLTRTLCAAAIACLAFAHDVRAQTAAQPSAASEALAREVVEAKGALNMFDSVIVGVIEYHKGVLLQSNPNLQKDLNDVATRLSAEFAPRRANLHAEIARAYASRFTEPELKEILAFYKTPIGKKLIVEEPKGVDEATKRVDEWANKFAEEVLTRIRAEMKKRGHNL
jgi:uncharacterized protein